MIEDNSILILSAALALTHAAMASVGAYHALTFKRDPRAALGWIAICLAIPFAGPVIYFVFGVNRVRTRAKKMGLEQVIYGQERPAGQSASIPPHHEALPENTQYLQNISDKVSQHPLVGGNQVQVFAKGELAYAAMIGAIDQAEKRIVLASYIMRSDSSGMAFVQALSRAQERGVEIRVLIDGVGEWYSWPRIGKKLTAAGIPFARFLPPKLIPPTIRLNLRNHRKLLIVDGHTAFTGGMNIDQAHAATKTQPASIRDHHFQLTGPIARQLEDVFWEDWVFATEESRPAPLPTAKQLQNLRCRTITDGPGEDLDKLSLIINAVIATARDSVWIVTPYFLPPRELLTAIQIAALRGAEISILLPAKNNLPVVHWASRNMLWEVLQWGAKVYYQPGPFVHSKLLVVDDHYVQIGSANLDARSLRLNFEVAVEIVDQQFARSLVHDLRAARETSVPVDLKELDERSFWTKLRDGIAWLGSPYL